MLNEEGFSLCKAELPLKAIYKLDHMIFILLMLQRKYRELCRLISNYMKEGSGDRLAFARLSANDY